MPQPTILITAATATDVRPVASDPSQWKSDGSPGNGCPGPVTLDIGRLRLINLDSQWWLHEFIVRDSVSNCPQNTMAAVTAWGFVRLTRRPVA